MSNQPLPILLILQFHLRIPLLFTLNQCVLETGPTIPDNRVLVHSSNFGHSDILLVLSFIQIHELLFGVEDQFVFEVGVYCLKGSGGQLFFVVHFVFVLLLGTALLAEEGFREFLSGCAVFAED